MKERERVVTPCQVNTSLSNDSFLRLSSSASQGRRASRNHPRKTRKDLSWFLVACLSSKLMASQIVGVVQSANGQPLAKVYVLVANTETGDICWWNCENAHKSYGCDGETAESFGWLTSPARTGADLAKTDGKGRFQFRSLRKGKFHLLAVHPEYGFLIQKNIEAVDHPESLILRLPPPTFVRGRIQGYKKGNTGWLFSAQEKASLILEGDMFFSHLSPSRPGGPPFFHFQPEAEIKSDGSFRVGPLPCGGRMQLHIRRLDLKRFQDSIVVAATMDVAEGKTTTFDYDLDAGALVGGRIIDSDSRPIKDASVALTIDPEPSNYSGVWGLGAYTDSKGRFAIRGVKPGRYELCAYRMGERSKESMMGTVCEGTQMEFRIIQKLTIGDQNPVEMVITITEADRKRAEDFRAKQDAQWQKEAEEFHKQAEAASRKDAEKTSHAATTQAAR